MKSIVDPRTAQEEGSDKHGTNHPVTMYCLDQNRRVIREENAKGFIAACKAARKLVGRSAVFLVAVRCSKDVVPGKFRDSFEPISINGFNQDCFLVGSGG